MTDLPQSAYLALSIKRAISAAQQRSHRYVTLEHLLLALLDDPSALEILEGVRADIPSIRGHISETVNRNLSTLYTPGEFDLHASYKVERVLQTASDDADRLGCEEVDAAFVLAALARETDNPAGDLLKKNGVAYASAVTWLYANRGMTPSSRVARTPPRAAPPQAAPAPKAEPARAKPASTAPVSTPSFPSAPTPAPSTPAAPASTAPVPAASAPVEAGAVVQTEPARQKAAETLDEALLAEAAEMDLGEPYELNAEIVEDGDNRIAPVPSQPPRNGAGHSGGDSTEHDIPREPVKPQRRPQPPRRSQKTQQEPPRRPHAPPPQQAPQQQAPQPGERVQPTQERDPPPQAEALSPQPVRRSRGEPQLPPRNRLDEMRLRTGNTVSTTKGRAPIPAPTPAPAPPQQQPQLPANRKQTAPVSLGKTKARGRSAAEQKKKPRRRVPRHQEALVGRLVENIPRRMRAAVTEHVEVRISHEDTQMIARGMDGRGEPKHHDIMITQTMSVALRAPDGGFTIELLSPETQWVFQHPENAEVYGRWRWAVTPQEPGQRRLQLIVAARSIGQNGIVGDSALPDQVITVRVRTNYWRALGRGLKWITALVMGGVLTELTLTGMKIFGGIDGPTLWR